MNAWRPAQNFELAQEIKGIFKGFLPDHVLEAAIATCRFEFQGPESVGLQSKNWGEWIRTNIQTFGNIPNGYGQVGPISCQRKHWWLSFDSRQIVEDILSYIDLTIDDVYEAFGKPELGEKYTVDLCEIIKRCIFHESMEIANTQVA